MTAPRFTGWSELPAALNDRREEIERLAEPLSALRVHDPAAPSEPAPADLAAIERLARELHARLDDEEFARWSAWMAPRPDRKPSAKRLAWILGPLHWRIQEVRTPESPEPADPLAGIAEGTIPRSDGTL